MTKPSVLALAAILVLSLAGAPPARAQLDQQKRCMAQCDRDQVECSNQIKSAKDYNAQTGAQKCGYVHLECVNACPQQQGPRN
jgi:hypothetical protein